MVVTRTRIGILIKGGLHLEMAHKVTAVLFDKTGTLTHGKPTITDIKIFPPKLSRSTFFELVAIAESSSEHPLARAIVDYAEKEELLVLQKDLAKNFQGGTGRGISCDVGKNTRVYVGNMDWMAESDFEVSEEIRSVAESLELKGNTVVMCAFESINSSEGSSSSSSSSTTSSSSAPRPFADRAVVGLLALADTIKPEAKPTIACLQAMGIGSWMVTGDNKVLLFSCNTRYYVASSVGNQQ